MQRATQKDEAAAGNEVSNTSATVLQKVAQKAKQTPAPLPKIPHDRERLDSLIKKISLAPNNQIIVADYLKNIEDKISAIHSWQKDKYVEGCYEAMQVALVEIRNTADALCSLITKYDTQGFANKLKKILKEKWTSDLSKELEKRLVPKDDTAALELKTKGLYAAQSFIETSQDLQNALRRQLERIKTFLEQLCKLTPRCYMTYAWSIHENEKQEYWIQPLERALKIQKTSFSANNFKTTAILINLGSVCAQLGETYVANGHYELASKIQEAHFYRDHPEMVPVLYKLSLIYWHLLPSADSLRSQAQGFLRRTIEINLNYLNARLFSALLVYE